MFSAIAWAQAAGEVTGPSVLEQLFPFVFIFFVFYFLIIRPQQKRGQRHGQFLEKMKRGDSVLTSSGILGTIEGITDKFVTLEVADGVRLRILKSQIASSAGEEGK